MKHEKKVKRAEPHPSVKAAVTRARHSKSLPAVSEEKAFARVTGVDTSPPLTANLANVRHEKELLKVLDHVVLVATKTSLDRLEKDVASTFAYAYWYANDVMRKSVERRLKAPGVAPVRKRRLLYLVDRLRRFPCMAPEQASAMKTLVSDWSDLSRSASRKAVTRAAKVNRYDKLAAAWGLEENVSRVMSMVLELQTRHFVDEHHLPSGYAKLDKDSHGHASQ